MNVNEVNKIKLDILLKAQIAMNYAVENQDATMVVAIAALIKAIN